MPASLLTDADITSSNLVRYPNPFFDLSRNFIPKQIKSLFKYCRDFFYTTGFLRNTVGKLTAYPITDVLYDSNIDEKSRDMYSVAFAHKLKLKKFLEEVGLDYFCFGNCFVTVYMKPKRLLTCISCKNSVTINAVKFKFEKYKFVGKCTGCGAEKAEFIPSDVTTTSIDNFRLLRLPPENVDIEYNPITGSSSYYYTVSAKLRGQILSGNRTVLSEIPLVFLESIQAGKKIELDAGNIFHFKTPTLAEEDQAWGKPIILSAMKTIYYLQTLRRGNEAIANEHIVPKKTISPANTATMDPFSQLNLRKWTGEVETTIKKWKVDPNYIAVFPIPMQYQELGGNARALLLTPEMKFVEEDIINSLGVPIEFIKGGASWTGSSVSLRIIENLFLSYRENLTDMLNYFVIPKMVDLLSYPRIFLKFQRFRMADDSESKQLAINANAGGKISDATLVEELGYDYEDEVSAMNNSATKSLEQKEKFGEQEATIQGKQQVILARYQTRAQRAAEKEEFVIRAENFQAELEKEHVDLPDDPSKVIERYALEFAHMDENTRNANLASMQQKMPITFMLVNERLQYELNRPPIQYQTQNVKKPSAEKAIGSREGDKIKIREKEKTKGQTRGNP